MRKTKWSLWNVSDLDVRTNNMVEGKILQTISYSILQYRLEPSIQPIGRQISSKYMISDRMSQAKRSRCTSTHAEDDNGWKKKPKQQSNRHSGETIHTRISPWWEKKINVDDFFIGILLAMAMSWIIFPFSWFFIFVSEQWFFSIKHSSVQFYRKQYSDKTMWRLVFHLSQWSQFPSMSIRSFLFYIFYSRLLFRKLSTRFFSFRTSSHRLVDYFQSKIVELRIHRNFSQRYLLSVLFLQDLVIIPWLNVEL